MKKNLKADENLNQKLIMDYNVGLNQSLLGASNTELQTVFGNQYIFGNNHVLLSGDHLQLPQVIGNPTFIEFQRLKPDRR